VSHRDAFVEFMRETLLDRLSRETSLQIFPCGSPWAPPPETMEKLAAYHTEHARIIPLIRNDPAAYKAANLKLEPKYLEAIRELEDVIAKSYAEFGSPSPTYGFFPAFASYGVITRDVENLWRRWWSLPNEGCAIAAIQYASCIICDDQQNPVFLAPVGEMGGGPPQLWEYESIASSEDCWQAENLKFLAETLSVPYLKSKLAEAMDKLKEAGRLRAATVSRILEHETFRAEKRIPRLLEILSKPQANLVEW
jgi:hypothetical protein